MYGPAFSVPEDETERRYYQVFCDRTTRNLAGHFPSDFWHRTAVRESHSDPAVRHAVIALGALTLSLDGSLPQYETTISPIDVSREHHQVALQQYNKAIAFLRQILAKGSPSIRTALVACLLFICFENFHGDHEGANSHVLCGLGLIDQWLAQNPPPNGSSASKREQLQTLHADEVFQTFSRLDSQSFAHLCSGSSQSLNPNPRLFLWDSIADRGVDVPFAFIDVLAARSCWDYLSQRCIAFHRMSQPIHDSDPVSHPPSWFEEERQSCILQLTQFEDAIWALVNTPSDSIFSSISPTILYLCNKITRMGLHAAGKRDESHWDGYLQEYEEIVMRSATLLHATKTSTLTHAGVFGFEVGIIAPLHLTAMKCRIPSIRRQAINMLLEYPTREGYWDGMLLGKADLWLMGIEEEGLDEFGLVPATSRWRLDIIESNTQERWISAKAIRDDPFGSSQWAFGNDTRETKISW